MLCNLKWWQTGSSRNEQIQCLRTRMDSAGYDFSSVYKLSANEPSRFIVQTTGDMDMLASVWSGRGRRTQAKRLMKVWSAAFEHQTSAANPSGMIRSTGTDGYSGLRSGFRVYIRN